jgi:hypothetical protein
MVTWQRVPESLIDPFVDQNAHLVTCKQKMLCFFQCSDGRITRDGRKALQKVFECFSPFQVVEQGLDRHSRAAKHRSSAKNGPIFYYDFHSTTRVGPNPGGGQRRRLVLTAGAPT